VDASPIQKVAYRPPESRFGLVTARLPVRVSCPDRSMSLGRSIEQPCRGDTTAPHAYRFATRRMISATACALLRLEDHSGLYGEAVHRLASSDTASLSSSTALRRGAKARPCARDESGGIAPATRHYLGRKASAGTSWSTNLRVDPSVIVAT
jgi:hypothetical protein